VPCGSMQRSARIDVYQIYIVNTNIGNAPMNNLLTLDEAAEVLGVDYKTVYRLVRSGKLVAGKIGRVYRISPDDLKAYFESTKPQKPVALQGLRCSVTGKTIVSELDIGGRDPETGEPICVEAWEALHRKVSTRQSKQK